MGLPDDNGLSRLLRSFSLKKLRSRVSSTSKGARQPPDAPHALPSSESSSPHSPAASPAGRQRSSPYEQHAPPPSHGPAVAEVPQLGSVAAALSLTPHARITVRIGAGCAPTAASSAAPLTPGPMPVASWAESDAVASTSSASDATGGPPCCSDASGASSPHGSCAAASPGASLADAAAAAGVFAGAAPPSPDSGAQPPAERQRAKVIAVSPNCPPALNTGDWSLDDFVMVTSLYRGAVAAVWLARHAASGELVVLKVYKRRKLSEMARFQLAREICLQIRMQHPHIVALHAAWKDTRHVVLMLEWARGGSLADVLSRAPGGSLPEAHVAEHVAAPLLSALAFLHEQKLIHRDVKHANVLLDAAGSLKLADFGLAIDASAEAVNTRLGTLTYLAPEVLLCPSKSSPFENKGAACGAAEPPTGYDSKVDVWGAGVMVYEALTGIMPFAAPTPGGVLQAIRERPIVLPAHLTPQAADFLGRMLERNVRRRATAAELLQHPWLAGAAAAVAAVAPPPPPPALATPQV